MGATCICSPAWMKFWRSVCSPAPRVPAAGTSTVATFNEKLQADSLFLPRMRWMHAMDAISKYSLPIPARSKNPQEVWGASGDGGGWENKVRGEFSLERRIKLLSQVVGADPMDP